MPLAPTDQQVRRVLLAVDQLLEMARITADNPDVIRDHLRLVREAAEGCPGTATFHRRHGQRTPPAG